MAFELTNQIEKHLVNDAIAWLTTVTPAGRYNTAIRITPDRAWAF